MIPGGQRRPTYRYLEPAPLPRPARLGRAIRWALLVAAALWAVGFFAVALISRSV